MKSIGKRLVLVSVIAATVCSMSLTAAQNQESTKRPGKGTKASADAQPAGKVPLNVKTGLWESTRTIKRAGELPIPAEMLSRLTPEQRARMEERLKANSAAHTQTTTEKSCLTSEDLERDKLKLVEAKECTTTVLSSTTTTVKAKLVCNLEGMHATGTLELAAADPEHVNGSYRSTVNADGHTMNVEGTWTAKWLGSSCGNVK